MENSAVINLKNLVSNAKKIKKLIPFGTKFCAVVKADAYGHGLETCASVLYPIVDQFAVALCEEGVKLRNSGIDKDILVLSPVFPFDSDLAVRYNLTLSVEDKKEIRAIEKSAKKFGRKVNVHIKYNTGMNRFGLDSIKDLKELIEFIARCKWVKVGGLYSHYSSPENVKSLRKQTEKFLLANNVVKEYNKDAVCHISASGGLLKEKYFDMCRVGIMLYGYTPFKTDKIKLKPVMSLYAPVLRRRTLKPFESALYGKVVNLSKKQIAVIRYGYADGLNRKRIKGQFNNRCMDVTAVIDNGKGKRYPVLKNAEETGKKQKTISYEVLVKVGLRAEKKYKR